MYVQKPFRSTGRAMWWWSAVVVRAFGPLSILPAAYANYQAFFSYLWVSSLMVCLYQLKPYSLGTLTHSTVWSAHMLLSSQLAGKYPCICINCSLLIQVQIKIKIQLIRLGGRLCFDLSPIQIRNNSAEASRASLIPTRCEIRPRSAVSVIKVFIFFSSWVYGSTQRSWFPCPENRDFITLKWQLKRFKKLSLDIFRKCIILLYIILATA